MSDAVRNGKLSRPNRIMNYPRRLHTVEPQKKLQIQREIVEFKQVVAFEMQSDGALQKAGLDRHNLRIVEARPERHLSRAGRQVQPIEDPRLFVRHASPF